MKPILFNLTASNAPLYYTEEQIPSEPSFERDADINVGIGTRAVFDISGVQIPGCVIIGIHHYPAKVGYDLYVPDHYDDKEGQHYTLVTNLDSINVKPIHNYSDEPLERIGHDLS